MMITFNGLKIINLNKSKMWAVFPTEELYMAEAAQQAFVMWKRIFTEWIATSVFELANTSNLEWHFNRNNGNYITEIWIPIAKSNKV